MAIDKPSPLSGEVRTTRRSERRKKVSLSAQIEEMGATRAQGP